MNPKRLVSLLLCTLLLCTLLPAVTPAARAEENDDMSDFLQGDGTEDSPYEIYDEWDLDAVQLQFFKFDQWDLHAVLMNDITISKKNEWLASSTGDQPFLGTFDGQGYAIIGLGIGATYCNGLIRYVGSGGVVRNLELRESRHTCGIWEYAMGCVVHINYGTVENCVVTGSIESDKGRIGGVVGVNYGRVTNCAFNGNASSTDYVGGVVGINYGVVENCHHTGNVYGQNDVGGVVGLNEGTVINCYHTGYEQPVTNDAVVSGNNYVGGVAGANGGRSSTATTRAT